MEYSFTRDTKGMLCFKSNSNYMQFCGKIFWIWDQGKKSCLLVCRLEQVSTKYITVIWIMRSEIWSKSFQFYIENSLSIRFRNTLTK
jgi:hypothetical protein